MMGIVMGVLLLVMGIACIRNGYLKTDGAQLFMGLVFIVMGIVAIIVRDHMT